MSVRRNITANYVGQLYATLISVAFVPFYIRFMGIEAYGLVGFYAMLQGWFALLDMGLTPTVTRQSAQFNGGAISALDLRQLFRSLESIFAVTAIAGALLLLALSGTIAEHWLKVETSEQAQVRNALCLMAVIVSLRWVCGLYRSAVIGFERIVWLAGFTVVIATVRFALIVPFLAYVGATPTHFFAYQLVAAVFEAAVLILYTYRLLPAVPGADVMRFKWEPVRKVLPFALSAAFTTVVWVVVSQTDKLLLSGLVPLTEYAYFTVAVLVASGITLLSSPVAGAILPRLTSLNAQGRESDLVELYRNATQLVAVIVVPIVLVLSLFPHQVLLAWTNQREIAVSAAPSLTLYAIGNGLLALAAFPYYLQVARGNLTLHVIYNVIFVALFIPLLLFAVSRFGLIGAGYAWILANLIPFALWLPVVHHRHLRGTHLKWVLRDIGVTVGPSFAAAWLLSKMVVWSSARGWLVIEIGGAYVLLLALAACSSSAIFGRLRAKLASSTVSRQRAEASEATQPGIRVREKIS